MCGVPVNSRVVQWPAVLWGQVAVGCRSSHHSDLKQHPSTLEGEKVTLFNTAVSLKNDYLNKCYLCAYIAIDKYNTFERGDDITIAEYIIEILFLINKQKKVEGHLCSLKL